MAFANRTLQRDFLGEAKFLERGPRWLDAASVHVQEKTFPDLQHVHVHDHASLGVKEKRVDTVAWRKARFLFLVPHLVGDEIVEKYMAVLAGEFQEAMKWLVHQGGSLVDRGIFRLWFAERADDRQFCVRLELRPACSCSSCSGLGNGSGMR